ncbi:MAG: fibronectin type III domain-containing protein, partial [Actinobacteria bacterium]|nr:fibronectin type III domain-containing protein [Actinomycetota bacterium]
PEIQQFDDCGDPCYAVVIENFDIRADSKVTIDYKADGKPVPTIGYDPEPINQSVGNGRLCVVSVGGDEDTPDPCAERLTTPKSLTATPGRKQVALSWRASVDTGNDNLLGYEIWKSTDGTTFAQLATVAETTFVDTGLSRQTDYWYYVVAIDQEGNRSVASNTAQTRTR